MSCTDLVCGTGEWAGPKPGDPSNNISLSAVGTYGGVNVVWTFPTTNPSAVSHIRLYRGTTADFSAAIQKGIVAGDHYFDSIPKSEIRQYFYWIQVISVNGTEQEPIGPASALPKALVDQTLEELSGLIDAGLLSQTLRTEIGRIPMNYAELMDEIANRIAGNEALSQALADVQNGLKDSLALIHQEAITRMDGVNAVASQLNTIAAVNADNAAAILTENTARVTADSALALRIDSVNAATKSAAAAVANVEVAKVGYAALASDSTTPYDGDNVTVVYPAAPYPAASFPEYALNRRRIIDKQGVLNWNRLPVGQVKPLVWVVGLPLATAVKKIGVTDANGGYASMEQAFLTQKDLNNGFKALYTTKLDVNGLVGGFGLYNNGNIVEAGFDASRFWIGKSGPTGVIGGVYPFIVEGDTTYIKKAIIKNADIDTLKIAGNAVVIPTSEIFVGTFATGQSYTCTFAVSALAAGERVPVHIHVGVVSTLYAGRFQLFCDNVSIADDSMVAGSRSYVGAAATVSNGTHVVRLTFVDWPSQQTRVSILTQVCKR